MGKSIKFIHCADIHLGSILHVRRKTDKDFKKIINEAVYNSFKRICESAIQLNVDFILISGDIYDKEARSVKGNSFFVNECRHLEKSSIEVYAIGGNHDPVNGGSELFNLPNNVHVLSSDKPEIIELRDNNEVLYGRIIGQSYRDSFESRKMYSGYNLPKDNVLNIALLHTELDKNKSSYVPCSISDLKEKESINYWALGHIHKLNILNENNPVIAYPGIPQGRDFGEEGLGCILYVEGEDNKIRNVNALPVCEVLWKSETIVINEDDDINNISDLENILISRCEEILKLKGNIVKGLHEQCAGYESFFKGFIIRFKVKGRGEIYNAIYDKEEETSEYLIDSLNSRFNSEKPFVYIDSIEISIWEPIRDIEALKNENTVLKGIKSAIKEILEDESLREQLIKRLGSVWEKKYNIEDANMKKLQLDEDILKDIVEQAEALAVDAVLKRGGEI